ncbi:lignin-forming anionic peroxidase-like [Senna tora]|uniref:peroxidase n=1 Tax=Senna tora TaxID=362788 RepID=A0A834SYW6_9FABA|nr:lignin-forming anionic peroxidase-like [Senna tora]
MKKKMKGKGRCVRVAGGEEICGPHVLGKDQSQRNVAVERLRPEAHDVVRKINVVDISYGGFVAYSMAAQFLEKMEKGCDASILLDDSSVFESEKTAGPNVNSVRGYNVIDQAKTEVEKICPRVVSCADILAVAARDASFSVGGPSWTVKLGRRDSTSAYKQIASSDLPSFRDKSLRSCPLASSPSNDQKLAPLDLVTPNSFDNNYFKNLIQKKGLLPSDQVLYNGGSTDNVVLEYSKNPTTFKSDFDSAMIKMGDIEPLVGSAGIVRRICSAIN